MALDWETEALPVLNAAYAASRRHDVSPYYGVTQDQINAELGREANDVHTGRALYYLEQAGYLRETAATDMHEGPLAVAFLEKGFQLVASWPRGTGDALLASLLEEVERRIQTASTEEERSALARFRDFALGVGRDVLVSVLSAYADRGARSIT